MSEAEIPYNQAHDHARESAPWGWYITIGIVGTLSLINFAMEYLRRWTVNHATEVLEQRNRVATDSQSKRLLPAASTLARQKLIIRLFHVYYYGRPNIVEVLWTIGYVVTFVSLTFYRAHEDGRWNWEDAMGYMVFAQFPLIIGLAGKNNVISFLTGISYERLNFLHRAAGRMAVLWSWIHAIGRLKLGLEAPHDFGSKYIAGAIAALTAMTVIEFTAEKPFRRRYYEVFIVTHLCFVVMLIVGAWVHHPEVAHWIQAGMALWVLDRIVSTGRFMWNNRIWIRGEKAAAEDRGSVELLSGDVLRLTVRGKKMSWAPGHHVFLSCQALGGMSVERHPFSILTLPTIGAATQEMVFLCRVQNGFTKRMRDSLHSDVEDVPIHVEGPYGTPVSLGTYDTVILIAGGVGITYAMSHFLGVIRDIRAGKSLTRRLRLIWCTKNAEDIDWISPLLESSLGPALPPSTEIEVDIHITKSAKADDPDAETVQSSQASFAQHDEKMVSVIALEILQPAADPSAAQAPTLGPPLFRNPFPQTPAGMSTASITNALQSAERPVGSAASSIKAPSLEAPHPRTERLQSVSSDTTYVLPLRTKGQLSPILAPYAHIRRVRADMDKVLQNDVDAAHGPVHVGVCGPMALSSVVRKAVERKMSPMRVMRGEQQTIDFYCEAPGW